MPYNVICLTCTVVALAFGPLHNITTKQLKLSVLTSKSEKIKQLKEKYLGFLFKRKNEVVPEKAVVTENEKSDPGELIKDDNDSQAED